MALTLWWTWTLQAWAAPPPADPDLARLSGPLRQASGLVTPLERLDWAALRPGAQGADTVQVVVELEPAADPEGVAESVAWLDPDLVVELVRPDALQLRVPHSALVAVAATAGVERVREPHYARAHAVTSEGVDQTFLLDWHDDGVTGEGVQVAILDIGFAGWTNVGDDEIPSDTTDGTTSGWQQSDHGTAVTEIVHDMAPDAELGLFNFQTDQEYVDRMEQIVNDGWQVVNASVGFDNVWHADGTSPYAQTVDWAVDNGVVYVAAAGNEGYNYVSGELTDKIDDDGRSESDGWVEINGHNGIWLPVAGGQAEASLRWTDPMGASSNDFDLVLFYDDADTSDDNVCGRSEETQDGTGDPYELAVCASSDSWVYARVVFHGEEADFPANREGFLYCFYGVDEEVATTSRTLTLPGDAAGAITVGAYRRRARLVLLPGPDRGRPHQARPGRTDRGEHQDLRQPLRDRGHLLRGATRHRGRGPAARRRPPHGPPGGQGLPPRQRRGSGPGRPGHPVRLGRRDPAGAARGLRLQQHGAHQLGPGPVAAAAPGRGPSQALTCSPGSSPAPRPPPGGCSRSRARRWTRAGLPSPVRASRC